MAGAFRCRRNLVKQPNWIRIQSTFLAVLLAAHSVFVCFPARAQIETEVTVSIAFPDGSTKSTRVSRAEAEVVDKPPYMLSEWVLAALRKLELPYRMQSDSKGIKITMIGDIADGPKGEWVYSANGISSPYRLNTQTIEGVSRVSFSYRTRSREEGM